jgi:MFS family permease
MNLIAEDVIRPDAGRSNFFSRERTIAGPAFNRWLVPPAALAIHLCIGMIYGFSVFWLPLGSAVGITKPKICPGNTGFFQSLVAMDCDWTSQSLGWTFSLAIVFLGSSAAVFGHWLEMAGPRKAGLLAAFCWGGGLLISGLGVYLHQIWLLWLGSGVIGGIGLGLGYISPVSTLIKWFPDRRGLATGLAIMGFGGGAMIGAPLADRLMKHFSTSDSAGVWQTFVTLGIIYSLFMVAGALGYRVPPEGWAPEGWTPPPPAANALVTHRHVHLYRAWKTPQFWLLWFVLMLNVSAGIGVLYIASPMLQEVFGGRLLGNDLGFDALSPDQKKQIASIAAGFTGLLSLCNIFGRIGWASASDRLGRKTTYATFFILGFCLYAFAPSAAYAGVVSLFVLAFCIILTMYGGGFATIPAYLADMFGTHHVGAIHGRLLTAWSTAGVVGPWLVNYLHDSQLKAGVPREQVYNEIIYVLAGLLLLGLACDLLVRPVAEKNFMTDEEVAAEKKITVARVRKEDDEIHADFEDFVEEGDESKRPTPVATPVAVAPNGFLFVFILSWAGVSIPLLWGIFITLQKTAMLFH